MHKVSVIVPVYNTSQYLEHCLKSKSYSDLEIIVVNDGSTDNSLEICEKFSQKDPRIRIINQTNAGVSFARNIGLDSASGDLVAFVDSDDYVAPQYFTHLVRWTLT